MKRHKEIFRKLYERWQLWGDKSFPIEYLDDFMDEFAAPVDGKFPDDFEVWWRAVMEDEE